ncbi:hypothetical protein KUTeg_010886 [Tegillarca granosa]|uniref:BTB domain-containing protein n=1 Tax=Tegillarca granosa TaxID=220873 RepID=A0ABQ9F5Q0_TEGGR|nr:hypothetical protein KUTeg_010886 [Tegillarca granosa]
MSDKDKDPQKTCLFLEESHLSDVALVVEGKKLFVNKATLAIASPVFNTMFYSDFKEKDAKEIPLPDKKYEDMVAFLKRIYPNSCCRKVDITTQVLPLLHEYDCKRQMLECEQFLTTTKDLKEKDFDPRKTSALFNAIKDVWSRRRDSVRAELYFKKIMLLKSKITDMIENEYFLI